MRMRLQMLAWLVFAGLAMQAWGADAGAGASGLEAGCSVKNVRARQRYPWNGKVDIDCEVRGSAGAGCLLTVAAVDKVAGTQLAVKTVSLNGGTGGANPVAVTIGQSGTAACRLTWDAEKDLPQGFRCSKVSISVEATEPAKKYLVIDLITGEKTYLAEPPAGGWGAEEFRTRKMAFCRIEPGEFDHFGSMFIAQVVGKILLRHIVFASTMPSEANCVICAAR